MVVIAILCGIAGFAAGWFGVGLGAAKVLEAAHGSREGYAAMVGFFTFGPVGGIAGALAGVGLTLRFGGGSAVWGQRLLIGAVVIAGLAGIGLALASSPTENRPSYSHVIQFELQVPAADLTGVEIPGPDAMWGAAGGQADDSPISRFFDRQCDGDTCLLAGSVAAAGSLDQFRIAVRLGQKSYRFPLDLPPVVNAAVDWSPWRVSAGRESSDRARLRWRIVSR
jgi:MFS family permease